MKEYARYVLAYVLWLISIAAGSVVGLLTRDAALNMLALASAGRMQQSPSLAFYTGLQLRAGNLWSYFLLGIVLIVMVVVLESWYRTAVPLGRLAARFFLVTAIELAVLCAAHAFYFFLFLAADLTTWRSGLLPALELLATAAAVGLYRWRSRRPARLQQTTG